MELFSIFGRILLKDDGVEDKLTSTAKKAESTGNTFDNVFGKIKSAALKLGAALGVALGFKDIIEKASASQQVLGQMDAALKSTGDASGLTKKQLIDLADAQSKVTKFSKGTNLATENLLLTFTNIKGKIYEQALPAVNDMSQALGQDTKSSAIQLGKALNDPIKGITALSRVGVSFTSQQKAQITAMEKAGNVAGAQSIILKELQKEFGGSAEAAGKTFSGQLAILKNNLSGVAIQLGSVLIPYLTSFFTNINSHMPQIQQTITNVINTVAPYVKGIIKDIGQIVSNLLPNLGISSKNAGSQILLLVKGGLQGLKDVFDWLAQHGDLVQAAVIGITTALISYKSIVLITTIAQEVQNAMLAIQAIRYGETALAMSVMKNSTTSATAAQWLLNAAMKASPVGIAIVAIAALVAALVLLYNKNATFRNFINTMWNEIKILFTTVCNEIKKVALEAWNVIGPTITNGIQTVQKWWNKIWPEIQQVFSDVWTAIKIILSPIIAWLYIVIKENLGFIQGAWNGIWNSICDIFKTIWNIIVDVVKTAWAIVSNEIKLGLDVITGIFNIFKDIFTGNWSGLWSDVKGLFSNVWDDISGIFKGVVGGIGNIFGDLISGALNWGKDLINGFIGGIKGAVGGLTNAVKDVANVIWSHLHFSTPEEGLLKDYETWMPDMIDGMAKGIQNHKYKLINSVKGLANDMKCGMNLKTSANIGTINGMQTQQPKKVDQHLYIQNLNVQSQGDKARTLQQLQFMAQI